MAVMSLRLVSPPPALRPPLSRMRLKSRPVLRSSLRTYRIPLPSRICRRLAHGSVQLGEGRRYSARFDAANPGHGRSGLYADHGRQGSGQDAQLLDMTGPRRQAALIKLVMEKQKPVVTAEGAKPVEPVKRPSGAPPPPSENPRGAGAAPAASDNLYDPIYQFPNYYSGNNGIDEEKRRDEEWYARRQEQKRNSVGRPWSVGGKVGTGGRA